MVVEDDIACHRPLRYFLRTRCRSAHYVNVANTKSPKHIVTYNMKPQGLGIDNGTLLSVRTDCRCLIRKTLPRLWPTGSRILKMDGFDVIPYNNVLMMIAEDGIYQYDYTDVTEIKQVSRLPIGK